jgi:two-component system, LuxR family, response regulator FixJ
MSIIAANADPTIFIVDADVDASRAVQELARSFGLRAQMYNDAREFLNQLDDLERDQLGCVVAEFEPSAVDALAIQRQLSERGFALPTIMASTAVDTALTVRALRAGALAVLDKPYREHELWSFIEEALAKSEEQSRRTRRRRELENRFKRLSPQDRQVLQLILEGCKNRTMSTRLAVSLRTVENRRKRVFDVMQAESVSQLTRMVMEYEFNLTPTVPTSDSWLALPFEQVA